MCVGDANFDIRDMGCCWGKVIDYGLWRGRISSMFIFLAGRASAMFSISKYVCPVSKINQPVWSNRYDARLPSGVHTKMVRIWEFLVQTQALAFLFLFLIFMKVR